MAVTYEFLRSLPAPQSLAQVNRGAILADLLEKFEAAVPAWTRDVDDPAYQALLNAAVREYALIEFMNARLRSTYLAYATGSDLDHLVGFAGVERNTGEADEDLVDRYLLTLRGLGIGTRDRIEADAKMSSVSVTATQITLAGGTTGTAITLYATKGLGVALSAGEIATLQTYMRDDTRLHIGDTLTVAATTAQAYTITLTATRDNSLSDVTAKANVERALYALVDEVRGEIGVGLSRASIIAAAGSVDGIRNISLTAPLADLPATAGQVLTNRKNATDVAVTVTT